MRVAVLNAQIPFVRGGAEVLADSLIREMNVRGHEAVLVTVPFLWYPPERIAEHVSSCWNIDLTEADGKRIDRVISLKFPVYCISHPNKVIWLCHQHREVYDLWERGKSGLTEHPEGESTRAFVKFADEEAFLGAKKIYAISQNVAKRLKKFNGRDCEVLYPPTPFLKGTEKAEGYDNFLLYPSRINRLKRQDLLLEAFCRAKSGMSLYVVGAVDDEEYYDKLRKIVHKSNAEDHVKFLGAVEEEMLQDLYSRARAVVFIPYDEDYGLITVEAFAHSKAVLTTTDSGGPTEFVKDGENGYVVKPEPDLLAEGIRKLSDERKARALGINAGKAWKNAGINWDHVVDELTK
jgi:glycosyltransferase involved in cell wall biosynthesis